MLNQNKIFSLLALTSAVLVISSKNPIHGLLALIGVFLNVSVLLVSLGIEFLGLILIIVYVGAVCVLFIFACMMLNEKIGLSKRVNYWHTTTVLILVFNYFLFNSNRVYNQHAWNNILVDWPSHVNSAFNVNLIGQVFYSVYNHHLIAMSWILLLAMVAAIKLSLNHQNKVKRQKLTNQIRQEIFTKLSR